MIRSGIDASKTQRRYWLLWLDSKNGRPLGIGAAFFIILALAPSLWHPEFAFTAVPKVKRAMTSRKNSRDISVKSTELVGVYYNGQTLQRFVRGKKNWMPPDHYMPGADAAELYRLGLATFVNHTKAIIRFDLAGPADLKKYRGKGKLRDTSCSPGERLMDRFVDVTCFGNNRDDSAVAAIDGWK